MFIYSVAARSIGTHTHTRLAGERTFTSTRAQTLPLPHGPSVPRAHLSLTTSSHRHRGMKPQRQELHELAPRVQSYSTTGFDVNGANTKTRHNKKKRNPHRMRAHCMSVAVWDLHWLALAPAGVLLRLCYWSVGAWASYYCKTQGVCCIASSPVSAPWHRCDAARLHPLPFCFNVVRAIFICDHLHPSVLPLLLQLESL